MPIFVSINNFTYIFIEHVKHTVDSFKMVPAFNRLKILFLICALFKRLLMSVHVATGFRHDLNINTELTAFSLS
jgi:hypothetical protein